MFIISSNTRLLLYVWTCTMDQELANAAAYAPSRGCVKWHYATMSKVWHQIENPTPVNRCQFTSRTIRPSLADLSWHDGALSIIVKWTWGTILPISSRSNLKWQSLRLFKMVAPTRTKTTRWVVTRDQFLIQKLVCNGQPLCRLKETTPKLRGKRHSSVVHFTNINNYSSVYCRHCIVLHT